MFFACHHVSSPINESFVFVWGVCAHMERAAYPARSVFISPFHGLQVPFLRVAYAPPHANPLQANGFTHG